MKSRLSDRAREARNAYAREWRHNHPEAAKRITNAYWERKAAEAASDSKEKAEGGDKV